jgi:hypothetical protein
MAYGVESGVCGFWLCGQGCEALLPNPGAFPANIGGTNSCIGAEILCKASPFHDRNCPAFVTKTVARTDFSLHLRANALARR